jgi:hypothetical protein
MVRHTLIAGVVAGVLAVAARPAAAQRAPDADSSATGIAPVVVTGHQWSSNPVLRADQQRRRLLDLQRETRALERQLREHDRTIATLELRLVKAKAVRDSLDRADAAATLRAAATAEPSDTREAPYPRQRDQ